MFRRSIAAIVSLVAAFALIGPAAANELVDTNVTEKVECMFRVYISEGGENGLECLT